jgi:hypothetical protein
VAERDLVVLLDAADAALWRSPPGEIEHAPLISLVTAVEQQILLPVMTALKSIEMEAAAAAVQAAAVQDASLFQQHESILRSGFAGTALNGICNFGEAPPPMSPEQQHGIKAEIQLGRLGLSACAIPFLPDSAAVDTTLSFVSSCWNENAAMRQAGSLAAGGEQAAVDSRVSLCQDETRGNLQRESRPESGRAPLSAAAGGGGEHLVLQTHPQEPPQNGGTRGSSKGKGQQSLGGVSRSSIAGSSGSGRAGLGRGSNSNKKDDGGGGSGSSGCGRQTAGGRESGGRLAGGSSDSGASRATADRGGDLGRGSRVVIPTTVKQGAGGSTLPAVSAQEAGPGWQQPAPGPVMRKYRRFGSKRQHVSAGAESATAARL